MDYEKEYKSLVAKVKKAHQFAQTDSTKSVLEDILPQLRESEEERIRQKLMWLLQQDICPFPEEEATKMIAYLEKQKEQKPAEWSEDYDEENLQTRFAFYTYKDDPSVLYLSNVFVEETSRNHGFGTRILKAAEKVAEAIGAITIRLKVKQDSPANNWYRKHGYAYMTFEDGYDWLEKNLEYMKPNKQKWSEEDEKHINLILLVLDAQWYWDGATGKRFNPYQDEIDWLKSLRPSWKPSEISRTEQILLVEGKKSPFTGGTVYRGMETQTIKFRGEDYTVPKFYYECGDTHEKFTDGTLDEMNIWEVVKAYFIRRGVSPFELVDIYESKKEQKPAEWSEEDERILKGIIGKIDHDQTYGVSKAEMLSFLKSLRPVSKESLQPHWKPSEEQMDALKELIDDANRAGWVTPGATELYEQLKKLM